MGRSQQVFALVCGDPIHPSPKSRRLLQFIQTGDHGHQHGLGGVLGILLIFQHLLAVVVDPVLDRPHQFLLGVQILLPAPADQFQQFFPLYLHAASLLCFSRFSAVPYVSLRPAGNIGGEIEKR